MDFIPADEAETEAHKAYQRVIDARNAFTIANNEYRAYIGDMTFDAHNDGGREDEYEEPTNEQYEELEALHIDREHARDELYAALEWFGEVSFSLASSGYALQEHIR